MGTYLTADLPPYVTAAGNMAQPYGINSEGLQASRLRAASTIEALKRAYRTLYRSGLGAGGGEARARGAGRRHVPRSRNSLDFLAQLASAA